MAIPQSLHHAAAQATNARALLQDPASLRMSQKPQLRRFEVSSLLPNGNISETRHIAPALPLFENAFCAFTRGSLLQTDQGPVAIEDLWPGDQILTVDGDYQPLIWKGRTTLVPSKGGDRGRHQLTSFMADCFGIHKPMSCVVAGPAARLLRPNTGIGASDPTADGVLTSVRNLRDGMNIFETAPPTVVETFHICLPRHAVIDVGGLLFETYHPGPDALKLVSYAIKTLYLNLFSHADKIADFGEIAYPRDSQTT